MKRVVDDDPKTDVYATTQPGAKDATTVTRGSTTDMAMPAMLPAAGYDIRDLIGKGGMGEVVAAHDLRIGRDVALKRMKGDTQSGEALTRFLREARIQARLDHPSIVPVYEIGDKDGAPYFTMKRVTGTTLTHRLADGGSLNRILRAFAEVCLAIEYAHFHGFVHRDLKPSNIMLGRFGEVYVLDWGVARVISDPEERPSTPVVRHDIQTFDETKTGAMLGTPGYMAPEQLRGLTPTPAADIYALGAILFEILAGEPLHPRGEAAVGSTLAKPQASPLQRRGGDKVPPELDALCIAALAEDPTARPNAHELAEAVQSYLDGDRDLDRRKKLAAQQLAAARDALTSATEDARATAMRRAGRALALDPESTDAAELTTQLLLETPNPMPKALEKDLDAHEGKIAQHRSWRAVWAYMSIVALAPLMFLLDVTSWPMVGAFYGCVLLGVFHAYLAAKHGRPSIASVLVVNLAIALMFTRILGPFIITPLAICCMLVGITSMRRINARPWIVIAWTCTAVLLPILFEVLHLLPKSWMVTKNVTLVHSTMFESVGTVGENVALVIANLVFTMVVGLVALAFSIKRQESQRQLFIREWLLRQMIPQRTPVEKRPWATRLR